MTHRRRELHGHGPGRPLHARLVDREARRREPVGRSGRGAGRSRGGLQGDQVAAPRGGRTGPAPTRRGRRRRSPTARSAATGSAPGIRPPTDATSRAVTAPHSGPPSSVSAVVVDRLVGDVDHREQHLVARRAQPADHGLDAAAVDGDGGARPGSATLAARTRTRSRYVASRLLRVVGLRSRR